jgi:acyl carrier protein
MTDTFDRLSAILIKDYKFTFEQLEMEVPLEVLGIDSLGTAELLFNIEDEFGVIMPPDPVRLTTLGDVVNFVDALVAARSVSPVRAANSPALLASQS